MEGVNARMYLSAWSGVVTGMTISDIEAIPDDKWTATFGGVTRPCSALIADTICFSRWATAAIKGQETQAFSEMDQLKEEFKDKSKAIAALKESNEAFTQALTTASDEKLNSMVMAPFGREIPVFIAANIVASHIWYHDGQLNYVQTLLGDDQVHWQLPS